MILAAVKMSAGTTALCCAIVCGGGPCQKVQSVCPLVGRFVHSWAKIQPARRSSVADRSESRAKRTRNAPFVHTSYRTAATKYSASLQPKQQQCNHKDIDNGTGVPTTPATDDRKKTAHLDGHIHAETQLRDSHGRLHNYLRISLTEKCSFRCRYCMPDEGISLTPGKELLTTSELLHLVDVFASLGVTAVRLTGGEPLLRKDLLEIVRHISTKHPQIHKIGITTNGLVLERHLDGLIDAGLTHVNISLDSLVPRKFEEITRRKGFEKVLRGIFSAEKRLPTKINCVVMRGFNEDEVPAFVELTRDHSLEVRFIEYMPFDGNRWSFDKVVPQKELEERIKKSIPDARPLPLEPHHTAKHFSTDAHRGRWGFISSMSQAFCSSCNRLRLTADGALRSCLFSAISDELSLRDILREAHTREKQSSSRQNQSKRHDEATVTQQDTAHCNETGQDTSTGLTDATDHSQHEQPVDDELRKKIREHLQNKHFSHGGHTVSKLAENENRPMITIGG